MQGAPSEIRRRVEEAGARLRAGDLPGALGILVPGAAQDQIEQVAARHVQLLTSQVREVQRRVMGPEPINPSGSRGLAQTVSVYVRALQEMRHGGEDASMLAGLLVDLQFGTLSRQLPPESRDRLLAGLIHAIVELAPRPSEATPGTSA